MAKTRNKRVNTRESSARSNANSKTSNAKKKNPPNRSKQAKAASKTISTRKQKQNGKAATKNALKKASTSSRTTNKRNKRKAVNRRKSASNGWLKKISYWSAVAAIWAVVLFAGVITYFSLTLPDPQIAGLSDRQPNVTILDFKGQVIATRGTRSDHIRLSQLPENLVKAVLAIEDKRFFHHPGIDPIALFRAIAANLRAGNIVQGGSTISQQLAKNLFLKSERTIRRKIEELLLAFWLEIKFSKREILELYLNRVYFGAGTYGVEAAAQRYFGKSARNVNLPESAMLAGLLKAPSRYAPTRNPELAQVRAELVLTMMADQGLITREAAQTAIESPAKVMTKAKQSSFGYAVDWILDLLPGYVGDINSNLIVETTLDSELQKIVQQAVTRRMNVSSKLLNAGEVAAIVMDNSGCVKALLGGRSYKKSQFNRAVNASRQPGSAFKPFVYLAAVEAGFRPSTQLFDQPISVNGWSPRNYSGRYRGSVTLRHSLARSINTVAVQLLMDVGRARVVKAARRLGINSELHDSPSLALGTAEVTLLELTTAYIPFANGGHGVLPHVIDRVRTSDGQLLYTRQGYGPGQIVDDRSVAAMNDMLSATLTWGTGRSAALLNHQAAGKTGTSQESRDAWFVGYTAHYTAGVWIGNDNGEKMRDVTGGGLPAQIWHDLMQSAHIGRHPAALPGMPGYVAQNAPFRNPQSRADRITGNFLRSILRGL